MSQTMDEADLALKAKHRTMWGLGDYPALADALVSPLGPILVSEAGIAAGQRVLDVGAGTGNVAIPAARRGAKVVASDLTPDLLAAGARKVEAEELDLTWEEADAEALPYADGSFDAVLSAIGAMFAPHHQRVADEMLRAVRPGGRIGMVNWTPQGFIGRMFATMKPYAPPPPPGAQPPPLWGDEEHVQELLGDRVDDLRLDRRMLPVGAFASGAEFRDYFKAVYGPTIVAYRNLADTPDRAAELDAALARIGDEALVDGVMEWEYLLVLGTRS